MITYLVTVQISCLKYNTVLQFRFFLIISQIKPTQLVAISQISFESVVSPLSLFFEIYLLKTWSLLSRRDSHSWILLVASPRAWRTHSSVVCIFFKLLTAFLTLFFFFLRLMYLFMAVLCLRCCPRCLLQLWQAGAAPRCGARVSHYSGFSCYGWSPGGLWASVVGSQSQ